MTNENTNEENAEMFEFEQVTEQDVIVTPVDPDMPSYGGEGWNEYVMSQFHDYETFDGNPTCGGLRRVSELLLGDIIESGPTQVFPANDSNGPGRATVVFKVVFNWNNSGTLRSYSEVADVWHGNTDDLFCAHPVATASTRAEGRALRKALKIRALAAEELTRKKDIVSIVQQSVKANTPTDGEWNEEESLSVQQINFINNKSKQLDISVMSFINSGEGEYDRIEKVTKSVASKMLAILNKYQNGSQDIPSEIKGYNPNWRD